MLTYLILLFTIIPAIELVLLIKIGTYIGAVNTLLIIVLTGVLGAYFARLQGFIVLNKIQNSLSQGLMPSAELLDGLMILVGGIVLLTPGFFTDALGFALLIPFTRALIKQLVKHKFESMIKEGQIVQSSPFTKNKQNYTDIDI